MHRLNKIFTLSSLSVLLVTIERFSFTTKVLLQPYSFLRLHELFQMTVLILLTVIIPVLLLREVSHNFDLIKSKKGWLWFLVFFIGIYFYATGNGLHEVSSFNFNQYCDAQNFDGDLCGGFFFNDYYTGNILYFIGGILMLIPLLVYEKMKSITTFNRRDLKILVANALIYAFAIFAYAAFDRVLVGMVYSLIVSSIALYFLWDVRKKMSSFPVITYTTLTYVVGTVAALVVRLIR